MNPKGGEKLKLIKLDYWTKLEALKFELINKYEIKNILLIGGAYAFVCACYLVCTALGNKFQVQKFKLGWHFINLMVSNKWKQFAMEDRGWLHQIRENVDI